jgi:DNA repair exonuclease SbcCD ATPase subunit
MDKNEELFKGTTFADLMSDVYHNSKKKDRQISQLIAQLQPLIRNASDATIIVPLIKEYLDVAVKNDDHLVKLTAIVQRYISTKQTIAGADSLLSDEEKQQLIKIAESTLESELTDEIEDLRTMDSKQSQLESRIQEAQNKIQGAKSDD